MQSCITASLRWRKVSLATELPNSIGLLIFIELILLGAR